MHFTYREATGDLQQGDLLRRTPEIDELLRDVHPYFHAQPDYRFLTVLTQSCDLVRRTGSACKSKYLIVAAVRPLESRINAELWRLQRSERERRLGLCAADRQGQLEQFVERLLNNNEPGYFYFHAEPSTEFSTPHVGYLALSVPLRSDDHYERCLQARVLQLSDVFQAKLGWLVGNMYSRVGTPDWAPDHVSPDWFKGQVDEIVRSLCVWADAKALERVGRAEKTLDKQNPGAKLTREEALEVIESVAKERAGRTDEAVKKIVDVIIQAEPELEPRRQRLELRVKNDATIAQLLK